MIDITKFEGLSVLVLDDEAILLKVVETSLRKQPYNIITAETAAEAFSILEERDVAVVISDYKMPKIQGVEFLKRVKESHPDAIRILMTAYADLGVSVEAINRVGVFRFILKPWEQIEFQNTIESALQYYTVHREKEDIERQLASFLRDAGDQQDTDSKEKPAKGPVAKNTTLKISGNGKPDDSLTSLLVREMANPLDEILGKMEVLYSRPNLTDQDKTLLLEVNQWLQTLDSLAKGIILSSENGNAKNYESVDLVEAIREALDSGQRLINSKNIEIIEEYPDHNPKMFGSKEQIKQVLVTVFQNVLGTITPGSLVTCRISNSADNSKKKTAQWEIVIESSVDVALKDSGQNSVPPEHAWVFPFTQAGWQISRTIVEHQAGKFYVDGNAQDNWNLHIVLPSGGNAP